MKLIKTLDGHTGIVHCVAVHKGKLMSGSDDKCIRVWSLNEYKCINALYGHDNTICEMTATDKYLFSGSYNIIHVCVTCN
jgi:WD40 repeat protein